MSHTLCDRCDQVSGCCLNFDGAPCRKLRSAEPNNFDRLHEMDVKQLAAFHAAHPCPPGRLAGKNACFSDGHSMEKCTACWLIWLESEEQKRKRGKTT